MTSHRGIEASADPLTTGGHELRISSNILVDLDRSAILVEDAHHIEEHIISHNTLVNNVHSGDIEMMRFETQDAANTSLRVYNNLFAGSDVVWDYGIVYDPDLAGTYNHGSNFFDNLRVQYSTTTGSQASSSYVNLSVPMSDFVNQDPMFMLPMSYQLDPMSPAVDSGNNVHVYGGIDYAGTARNKGGGTDIGAYEQ